MKNSLRIVDQKVKGMLIFSLFLSACNPYADVEKIEEEIFSSFPLSEYHSLQNHSDTIVFYTPAKLQSNLQKVERWRQQLSLEAPGKNWPREKVIWYNEIGNYLDLLNGYFTTFQQDPSRYNLGGKLRQILSAPQLSPEQKAERLARNLELATSYYLNAQACLVHPGAEKTRLAIQKQRLGMQLMEGPLRDSLRLWSLSAQEARSIDKALYIAILSCKDYVAYCNSLLFEQREVDYHQKK